MLICRLELHTVLASIYVLSSSQLRGKGSHLARSHSLKFQSQESKQHNHNRNHQVPFILPLIHSLLIAVIKPVFVLEYSFLFNTTSSPWFAFVSKKLHYPTRLSELSKLSSQRSA
jgi:hypothetical protein